MFLILISCLCESSGEYCVKNVTGINQNTKSILVVDDDEAIREVLKMSLEMEGYPVMTATNGKDALDILSKSPDQGLILLDLMMPVMNGWEFVEEFQKIERYSNIPIILISAYSERAKNIPVIREVFSKPMNFNTLLDRVKNYYYGFQEAKSF